MGQLDGKVAIVTGGGSGIGKGIARAYAEEGCAVVIAGRNAQRLDAVAEELRATGSTIVPIPTNVTDEAQVKALFAQTMERFGRLDIVVNSSGAFDGGPIDEISLDAWNNVIGANLTGPFLCIREAFPIMKKAGGGRIINIGSISAQRTRENMAPYTSSKFGVWGPHPERGAGGAALRHRRELPAPGQHPRGATRRRPAGGPQRGRRADDRRGGHGARCAPHGDAPAGGQHARGDRPAHHAAVRRTRVRGGD